MLLAGGELARELMITAGRGCGGIVVNSRHRFLDCLRGADPGGAAREPEVFPVWQNAISLAGVLVCVAALCLAAIAFIYWFLPETKGLPVEDIVTLFEKNRTAAR